MMAGTSQERPTATFFTEEATRQILSRISNVFNDPDLCDATFIVGDDSDKEEIKAPSQFMSIASPYFKKLFYPPSGKIEFIEMICTALGSICAIDNTNNEELKHFHFSQ